MRKTLTLLFLLAGLALRAQTAQEPDTTKISFVYVIWEDIVSTDSGWHSLDVVKDWVDTQNSMVTQVGFLLREDENYIILMDSYFQDGTLGAVTRIPRGVIKKMIYINVNEK